MSRIKKSKGISGAGVCVLLVKHNKILLGQRHDDPAKADSALHGAGTWTLPGGKIDFGENFENAIYREALEETSIKINQHKLKLISVTNDQVADAHFVTLGFYCEDFDGKPQVMEPDEITQWQWFDLDNLPSPIFFPSEKAIKNYLIGEIYKH